jgi:thiol-disulfide isomerase/thioredoxin
MKRVLPPILFVSVSLALPGCGDTPTTPPSRTEKPHESEKPPPPEKPSPQPEQPPAPVRPETPPAGSRTTPVNEFEHVMARAKAENRLVFVEFSAVWCPPCQQMRRTTFADPRVQSRLAEYLTLFVDCDRDPGLVQHFGVRGIPAYFVLRPDRLIMRSETGYRGPPEFLRWLDGAR